MVSVLWCSENKYNMGVIFIREEREAADPIRKLSVLPLPTIPIAPPSPMIRTQSSLDQEDPIWSQGGVGVRNKNELVKTREHVDVTLLKRMLQSFIMSNAEKTQ